MVTKPLNEHNRRDAEPCEKALAGVVPRLELKLAQMLADEGVRTGARE